MAKIIKMKPNPIIIIPTEILKIDVASIFFFFKYIQNTETLYPKTIIKSGLIDWNQLAGISILKRERYLFVFS